MATLKSEQAILKSYGITPQPNSGRSKIGSQKGDGQDDLFVWDVKEAAKSFRFDEATWTKICTDAYRVDPYKYPALLIVLGGTTELALIEASVLKHLRQMLGTLSEMMEDYENDNA